MRGSSPYFTSAGDDLTFAIDIPVHLRPTFNSMVAEIVEYRLYRYLVSRSAKAAGERRTLVSADGASIDAAFVLDYVLGRPASLFFESAGGRAGTPESRNVEYVAGVEIVLERLQSLGAHILDGYVDSGRVKDLPIADRRLHPGDGLHYPIELEQVQHLEDLRKALLRSMRGVGRVPGSGATGGNMRKAMRIVVAGLDAYSPTDLADYLAGTGPTPLPRASATTLPFTADRSS